MSAAAGVAPRNGYDASHKPNDAGEGKRDPLQEMSDLLALALAASKDPSQKWKLQKAIDEGRVEAAFNPSSSQKNQTVTALCFKSLAHQIYRHRGKLFLGAVIGFSWLSYKICTY